MTTDRRTFLRTAGAAAGVTLFAPASIKGDDRSWPSPLSRGERVAPAPRSLRVLILGGTGFIGPHHVNYAVARGHRVTIFNRGRQPEGVPESVEQLVGDRNGDLRSLEGREWDVVLDLPTTLPAWVRGVGEVLRDRVSHYTFISTIGVNADFDRDGLGVDGPVQQYQGDADPFSLTQLPPGAYGALKAMSEAEAERQFPGRTLVVRPGLIVGPGDPTDRFSYWPIRMERGGEVLAPGHPNDPVQFVDARDLAEWTVRMAEAGETGVYNLTGPAQTLTIGETLGAVRGTYSEPMHLTWVPSDFLLGQGVEPWHGAGGPLPLWTPTPQVRALMRADVSPAVAKGLTFRPLADTSRDTLAWHHSRTRERREALAAGMDADRERELLRAWHAAR
jgi:2'-hydroxyisoflavone reductase